MPAETPTPIATSGLVAQLVAGDLRGPDDIPIAGVAGIDDASEHDLTFIRSGEYAARWRTTRARCALVTRGVDVPEHDPAARALIAVDSADHALRQLLQIAAEQRPTQHFRAGVHPTAVIAETAQVSPEASVGPACVVGEACVVPARCVLRSNVTLADRVVLGQGCDLHPGARLEIGVTAGARCEIHANAVLGSDGFGYLPDPAGAAPPLKIPHLGGVRLGDDVEIGACTTIDRGKFADTTVGNGTKIDNHVQIGHSCRIGHGVLICGGTHIGGSTTIGDGAIVGGSCAIPDNVTIHPRAVLGGGAHVAGDIRPGEPYIGLPARPKSQTIEAWKASLRSLKNREEMRDLIRRVRALEAAAGTPTQPNIPEQTP